MSKRVRKKAGGLHGVVMGLAIVATAALFVVVSLILPTSRLRYRVTLEVDTPQGVQTGSSVIEVAIERSMPFWGSNGIRFRVRGEATAVELPDGRLLLALLYESMNVSLPELAARQGHADPPLSREYQYPVGRGWWEMRWRRPVIAVDLVEAYGPRGRYYPEMVVLRPDDPLSVRRVEPLAAEAALGTGTRLRRMTIAIVGAPLTYGLEERMPWITGVSHRNMSPEQNGPLRHFLTPSSFVAT